MRHKLRALGRYTLLVFLSLFILLPILWMLSTALKSEAETYSLSQRWIPQELSFEGFKKFFSVYNFGRMMANSLASCLWSVVVCLIASSLCGYGVSRFRFRARGALMSFLLLTQLFPSVMLVVPFYALLSRVGLTNSLTGLVIVYAATNVAFASWMMVSYFKTVPIELDEAARVDGAGSLRIFFSIILPLVVPGLAAVALFVLFQGWNEYLYSSVLISSDRLKTITVGIISLNSQYQIKWNDLMAASTISSLPLVILFICLQRYFIAGMTGGAVKS